MLTFITYYLLIGLIWTALHEWVFDGLDNGARTRLLIFWPVTLVAVIMGLIEAMIDKMNNKDEE